MHIQEVLEWGKTLNFIDGNVNENLECEYVQSEGCSKKYVIPTAWPLELGVTRTYKLIGVINLCKKTVRSSVYFSHKNRF